MVHVFFVLPFLVIALSWLNGAFDNIGLTASLALFADSIADGEPSRYFTQRTLCTTYGQVMGSLVECAFLCTTWKPMDRQGVCPCHAHCSKHHVSFVWFVLWFFRDVEQATSRDDHDDDYTSCAEEVVSCNHSQHYIQRRRKSKYKVFACCEWTGNSGRRK
jgi:hypothetical protein